MIERIDKIIASQGRYSRSEVKKLIRGGLVKIDGRPVRSADEKANPDTAVISVNSQPLTVKKRLLIMLNKPKGVVSASRDASLPTVTDLLPDSLRRQGLFPAGRLDADTTGFVLITDDGELAHRLLSPKSHVDKVYHARLARRVDENTARLFERGVELKDGSVCLSAQLRVLEDADSPLVEVTLHEGMYHQIKRMFAACQNSVTDLRRVKIGGVELDEALAPGECRELTPQEEARLLP